MADGLELVGPVLVMPAEEVAHEPEDSGLAVWIRCRCRGGGLSTRTKSALRYLRVVAGEVAETPCRGQRRRRRRGGQVPRCRRRMPRRQCECRDRNRRRRRARGWRRWIAFGHAQKLQGVAPQDTLAEGACKEAVLPPHPLSVLCLRMLLQATTDRVTPSATFGCGGGEQFLPVACVMIIRE